MDSKQASHEITVCQFINTLSSGAYDQSGEIVRRSNAAVEDGARATTSGQQISLTLVIFGICACSLCCIIAFSIDKVSFSRPEYSRWGCGLRYVVRGEDERKVAPRILL